MLFKSVLFAAVSVQLSRAVVLEGTDKDAEFLSAATKEFFDKSKKGVGISESRQATADSGSSGNSTASAIASQVQSALSQLDLGFGIYKMCPFPFSYLHQCEGSSDCPDSDCCGMYAFPGPNRWRRSCCVPDGVTTIARVARLCIKNNDNKVGTTNGSGNAGRPLSASSVFQDVVAQALGVNTANSELSDLDNDDDDDVKKL